jgi:hypothetical protein
VKKPGNRKNAKGEDMKKTIIIAVFLIGLTAGPAAAKDGWYLGASFVQNNMEGSGVNSLDAAVGLGIRGGYSFGPVALELSIFGSKHTDSRADYGDARFSGLSIDAKVPLFPTYETNKVYVLIGFGGYGLKQYDPTLSAEATYSGGGFDFGAGVEHFFGEHLALNLAAIQRTIKYDKREAQGTKITLPKRLDGDVFTLEAGLNYYF